MTFSTAINYALNGPALKQLYIPTTAGVKFKAQAWIETFGSRTSKQAESFFNMTLAPLEKILAQHLVKPITLPLVACSVFPFLFFVFWWLFTWEDRFAWL